MVSTAVESREVSPEKPAAASLVRLVTTVPYHLEGSATLRGCVLMSELDEPVALPVLDVSDLRVAYGARTAVDGVTFQICRGEIFGLLGPNGAGKTSTLSAIEGLVRPKSGRLLVDGHRWRRSGPQRIRGFPLSEPLDSDFARLRKRF